MMDGMDMSQTEMEKKMDLCQGDATADCLGPEEHSVIMSLLEHRHLIERRTVNIYDGRTTPRRLVGVLANTTSADPSVAAHLQAHVYGMHRLEGRGGRVRQWDPLYREMFARLDGIDMVHEFLGDGVSVRHTGASPCAVELIRRHAATVSDFIAVGEEEVFREHEVPEVCSLDE